MEDVIDLSRALIWHLALHLHLQEIVDCGFQLCLDESEFLVNLVPEDFAEDGDIVISGGVFLDA